MQSSYAEHLRQYRENVDIFNKDCKIKRIDIRKALLNRKVRSAL